MPLRFIAGLVGLGGIGVAKAVDKIQTTRCANTLQREYDYRAAIGVPQFGFYPHMIKLITVEARPDMPEAKDGKHYGYYYQNKWYPGYDFTVETSAYSNPKKSIAEAFDRHREKARYYSRIYKT